MARPREFWESLIEQYERGETAQAAFAARHRVSVSALRHWLYRLRRERGVGGPRLVEVVPGEPVTAAACSSDLLELAVTGHGVALRFTEAVDPAYVARLVGALRAAC